MNLRGTNQEKARPYNRRIVLECIRNHGPSTRSAIAERVGLTVQTVSTIVRELEEQGYLLPVRGEPKSRGYPPTTLHINPDGGFAIGVSVTPLGVDAALMNLAGDIIGSASRPSPQPSPSAAMALIEELCAEMRALRPSVRILGVGMAMPGPFEVEGISFVGSTTLNGWSGVPVRARLEEVSRLPAFIAVDTVAAAIGVRLYGEGAEFSQFYYLHFGVGLGGTMIENGVPLRGAWGNAGEIGHLPLVPDGRPCPCGNRGCLERYLSLDGFGQRPEGQSEAEWVDEVTPIFHRAVTTIENLFDPQTIILGGIAPVHLLKQLVDTASHLPNSVAHRGDRIAPRVIAGGGPRSVLRGAAALAVSGILSPRHEPIVSLDRMRKRDPFSNGLFA
ncbi:ROK family transcriptional regulator [Devosia nitrariae]|uniref:Transcriptional regulator n=1 Tax=Devosia nitrariae TaxID=2071872 RepID=A0ABQ5W0U2_9HYPH|nr:ROK family transcriptional regulator [Devosia nitrariae]GLQ53690.1 transcriptional regulator [Devosia nitrariae]